MNIIYVSNFSLEQIQSKITKILDAMDIVLTGGKQYRLNDTQGDVMVTRESLANLQTALDFWEAKLNEISNEGSGIISLESNR